ncbi:MAG: flippase-like domain-containing protein [Gemmatimonadaceae bacterium]|nr:flippase-like domain-containing protein [Gemmatimonadaceae bacterium]MCW5827375.1 flippase-like domain-containing protein [Gemmatimonadaceae bacterium]
MRLDWRAVLGIALSIALLWFTLRGVHLREVWEILASSNLALWIACTVTATAIFPLRARRWQAILAPVAGRIPFAPLWHSTAVGMMVNNVFPARAGELARAFALSRERREVRFTTAFASLAVDRLFDGVVVLALMLLATLDSRFPADATILGATAWSIAATAGLFLSAVFVALAALAYAPEQMLRLVDRIAGAIVPRLAPKLRSLLEGFAGGLGVFREPMLALEVLWWTLLHWLCNAAAFYLGFLALGLAAPMSAALFVQGLIAIGVALPSSPGFFGPFEAAGTAGLGLYGIPAASAVSWAIGFHLLSFVPITVLGAWYFTRLNLHLRDITAAEKEPRP